MTTAVVLSGGSSLGAAQVGMLAALLQSGVRADLFVGTSVGALNAAWAAADPTPAGVAVMDRIWRGLGRRDVFPTSPWHGVLAMSGHRRGMVPDTALRALLRRHLRYSRLEDAAVPVHVVATDVGTGCDALFSSGPAVEALLASAAIPGVLPPVRIGGRWYADGGLVNNTPISHAAALGADTVWVLPAGYPCARPDPPSSPVGMALHGLTLLVQRRMLAEAEEYQDRVELRIVPPLCPIALSPADFSQTGDLIDRAYASTRHWLRHEHGRGGPAMLAPHTHPPGPVSAGPVVASGEGLTDR